MNLDGTYLSKYSRAEWLAWQVVVQELKKLDIDINKEDKLNDALKQWAKFHHMFKKDMEK